MKNIVMADCEKEELLSFMEQLNEHSNEKYELEVHIANWRRTGRMSELKRYFTYFATPIKYFVHRKKYGNIIGWQQFYALIFCFYCSIFKVRKCNTVVAWNYTYKEKNSVFSKLYKWFIKKCLSKEYLDYIHVPSSNYADIISRDFDFPRERIIVTTFGINDEYEIYSKMPAPKHYKKDQYMLAIGRSNRDYDFLLEAWEDINYKLVIISDTYEKQSLNKNVSIKNNISGDAQYPWIANCKAVIIPIDDGTICSGDTVLLTAMSLERIIVVTSPSTLSEMYIENGKDGLTVVKETERFKKLISEIINNQYSYLGKNARVRFLKNFTRGRMGKILADAIAPAKIPAGQS